MNKRALKKEVEKYAPLDYKPRYYEDKLFGNDYGISLKNVTQTGYTNDIRDITPVFNQYNDPSKKIEGFSNFHNVYSLDVPEVKTNGNKSNQMYLSEYYPSFPCKYYDNRQGISIASMARCQSDRQLKAYMDHLPTIEKAAEKSGQEHQAYMKSSSKNLMEEELELVKMKEQYKTMKHMYQRKREEYLDKKERYY